VHKCDSWDLSLSFDTVSFLTLSFFQLSHALSNRVVSDLVAHVDDTLRILQFPYLSWSSQVPLALDSIHLVSFSFIQVSQVANGRIIIFTPSIFLVISRKFHMKSISLQGHVHLISRDLRFSELWGRPILTLSMVS
jgi:hypothetical protein